ncbi:MAG: PHB depolymerase family esterase [Betaproteobacteria bacterium]
MRRRGAEDETRGLWSRILGALARWFRRAPTPGRYLAGRAGAWNGWLATHPTVLPRRDYRLYIPKSLSRFRAAPLIVLLHGCRQTPDEIARGTRIEALADRLGCYVLLPQQSEQANPYRCWNWFDIATASGIGEAAIVAAMMDKALKWRRVDPERTAAIGMSAGAALAAILGVHHGDKVRAVVSVAGIASGAAATPLTALSVMRRGPETDVASIGRAAHATAKPAARRVPLLAIHGRHDDVVAPLHAAALARQFLARNGLDVPSGSDAALPDPDHVRRESPNRGHGFHVRDWETDGRVVVRLVEVDDLAHAWSGGDSRLAFNDAAGPDATAMIDAFLESAWPKR